MAQRTKELSPARSGRGDRLSIACFLCVRSIGFWCFLLDSRDFDLIEGCREHPRVVGGFEFVLGSSEPLVG